MRSVSHKQMDSRRQGLASVVVLVCLTLLSLIGVLMIKQVTSRRQLAKVQARRLQTEYLAEAGLRRAQARLANDPKYSGETWTIPASELGFLAAGNSSEAALASSQFDAIVTISLEPSKDDPKRREVRVQADYPRDPQLRSRQSRHIVVDVESQPNAVGGSNK